jgi:hypothetical protein
MKLVDILFFFTVALLTCLILVMCVMTPIGE